VYEDKLPSRGGDPPQRLLQRRSTITAAARYTPLGVFTNGKEPCRQLHSPPRDPDVAHSERKNVFSSLI